MGVLSGKQLKFDDYEWSELGVRLHFIAPDPGGGRPSDYYVFLTNAELEGNTAAQLGPIIQGRLDRNFGTAAINTKLDGKIGQTMTVT